MLVAEDISAQRENMTEIRFSVIVPVYEHWHLVPMLVTCLECQTLPQHCFEVLLVDNGSKHFIPPESLPQNIRILHCDTPGSYAARNHGIAHAKGEWFAFTDSDCRPCNHWLEHLEAAIGEFHDEMVILAGDVKVVSDSPKPNAYEMYDMVKGIPQAWYVSRGYAATANLTVHRNTIAIVSGFDAKRFSGGDADFCRRAVAQGAWLSFLADAVVEHPARDSWQAVATKARRIKGGQLRSGPIPKRLLWLVRTLLPPSIAIWRFMKDDKHPHTYRIIACCVQFRMWLFEIYEIFFIFLRSSIERR